MIGVRQHGRGQPSHCDIQRTKTTTFFYLAVSIAFLWFDPIHHSVHSFGVLSLLLLKQSWSSLLPPFFSDLLLLLHQVRNSCSCYLDERGFFFQSTISNHHHSNGRVTPTTPMLWILKSHVLGSLSRWNELPQCGNWILTGICRCIRFVPKSSIRWILVDWLDSNPRSIDVRCQWPNFG